MQSPEEDHDLRDQIAGLNRLAGTKKTEVPGSQAGRDLAVVRLVSRALANGATWAQIGQALTGTRDARLAKKIAKRMARSAQRDLLRNGDFGGE